MQVLQYNERNPLHMLKAGESRGRPIRTPVGRWVTDLAELDKAICLCPDCSPKFDHRAYGYDGANRPPLNHGVRGECDGCKAKGVLCNIYVKNLHY